jgi:hypothetical protein
MPGAIAGEDTGIYNFITKASQDDVLVYYLGTLPLYGWTYTPNMQPRPYKWFTVISNSKGGFIIYLGNGFLDFMYIYEENGLTFVTIFYNP